MIIRVIDLETTGLPPDASVCEAAFVDVDSADDTGIHIMRNWHHLVFPTTPMSLEARATHHITDEEIAQSGISWGQARQTMMIVLQSTYEGPAFYCAHNADFEKAFFDPEGDQWIDTWKVALRLWPDSPSHSNQVLRYFLNLNVGPEAMPPHRALPDAWVTAHILLRALEEAAVDQLIQWSGEPPYLTKLAFGKHRGQKFSDVPKDYLAWIIKQDMEPGVIAAARRVLEEGRNQNV